MSTEERDYSKRKTIRFEPEIFAGIQQFRAEQLKNAKNVDDEMTFTDVVNILCKQALENKK